MMNAISATSAPAAVDPEGVADSEVDPNEKSMQSKLLQLAGAIVAGSPMVSIRHLSQTLVPI